METATKHHYLRLLINALEIAESAVDELEEELTEETFDRHYNEYFELQTHIATLKAEIKRVRRELGVSRKVVSKLLQK